MLCGDKGAGSGIELTTFEFAKVVGAFSAAINLCEEQERGRRNDEFNWILNGH